ncbi:SGNH/GDSL hydrolase family protein [Aggregatimonas sangjinii]|uniref:SGNH/GDSL hydrolase family protein n=1 Tax=Aggregatimonas sangjinii TaxID=2583587 RepID=A0A5B7SPF4_9FLAO|nr:SGNH/GDSL hydrolase family protein [Aggregatimonas sangjinii]QCW98880.1 SGNH/GDSL hydrolase family protein [Aggregatimonas sangjinii]
MTGHGLLFRKLYLLVPLWLFVSCSASDINTPEDKEATLRYLALGDSYTIGESVSASASFPMKLTTKLNEQLDKKTKVDILATTGWRTDNLLNAMEAQALSTDYDIVTLLIGVNNQFQNRPFSQYETEFNTLLEQAIELAKGENNSVFVISIPDYAYTPFSANSDREQISSDIDRYNDYAEETAIASGIRFINITDITRMGLEEPELIASDGLHPSGEAYRRFVERLFPLVRSHLSE